ncbi:MAG: magnesium chelatase ATPase subunit I [Saprospiraceae bacterium]|nr:magnesium chelatase ATPase subunit I [Saprospiraceae bacterium]MCB9323737.1 magnesium chelatase ATPase subunit I [Lewinellaceae bacterium]
MSKKIHFPFTAIVGQEEMKLALILNAIDRGIGGVLIMGHRGTAKSTSVRALASLLPPLEENEVMAEISVQGERTKMPLNVLREEAVPIVDLPLSATEDRVVGTLDIEMALTHGKKSFEPGLLARAHGGFLYIDEVNLLEDHLVDLLLDVAVSGINIVEREGLSVRHPARFVLVGSGNPEEGDLRPQLLDRFGLYTEIFTISDIEKRVEVVLRTEAFRQNPVAFIAKWEGEQERLREKIKKARALFPEVSISEKLMARAIELCLKLKIDGHRGEIIITRAAKALAAFNGKKVVHTEDLKAVAPMCLRHRLRKDPLEEIDSGIKIREVMADLFPGT